MLYFGISISLSFLFFHYFKKNMREHNETFLLCPQFVSRIFSGNIVNTIKKFKERSDFVNSLWLSETEPLRNPPDFPSDTILEADVCVIGTGIFGTTCAYYLSKLGFKVILLERNYVGGQTTGHTTAKITSQHGLFYNYLRKSFSTGFAKDYLEANEKAIENIEDIIQKEKIKCDFERQNHFVYTTRKEDIKNLKREIKTLEKLGFPCEYVTKTAIPFNIEGAVCFKKQAQFHPLKYLLGLCRAIVENGSDIFTDTTVYDIQKQNQDYITFSTNLKVRSKYVIVATDYPFLKLPGFYFTKMYQETSYLIAVECSKPLSKGMYIGFGNPAFSFRSANYKGKRLLLVGGGNHKTGHPSSYQDTYGLLEQEAKKFDPNCKVLFKWDTRDCISLDKLPYIGSYSSFFPNVFVGTGFKKWGMTLSNVAANIVVDLIQGKTNKYAYLFTPSRLHPIKNRTEMKNILVQSTNSILLDKFRGPQMNFDDIANNSGGIVEINHQKVGIYKDSSGKIFAVKPICTHLGCLLSWNDVDKTWDCPCHGSRFSFDGKNLSDPAFKDLERFQ